LLGYLAWSADSGSVYFDTLINDEPGYFRVRVGDAKLERVASYSGKWNGRNG
jgi:hypothetical protein